jgi:hypothetical protein
MIRLQAGQGKIGFRVSILATGERLLSSPERPPTSHAIATGEYFLGGKEMGNEV